MSIEKYISTQLSLHPSMTAQDAIKQCYQAAFGAEHLLSDETAAREYLEKELALSPESDEPLFEDISSEVARVNLGAWKKAGLPLDLLFDLFKKSSSPCENGKALFLSFLEEVKVLYPEYASGIDGYLHGGIVPLHHSEKYVKSEHPHYRIVKKSLLSSAKIIDTGK